MLVEFLVRGAAVDKDERMGLPVVLMPGPMHQAVAAGLDGHCELIRLWEETDPDGSRGRPRTAPSRSVSPFPTTTALGRRSATGTTRPSSRWPLTWTS